MAREEDIVVDEESRKGAKQIQVDISNGTRTGMGEFTEKPKGSHLQVSHKSAGKELHLHACKAQTAPKFYLPVNTNPAP
jgi:post-segregation antitoxin (ccd killing protein)